MISYVDAVSCTGQESTRKCYSQILCGVDLTFVFVCTNKNTIQWAWFGFVLKKTCVCVCVSLGRSRWTASGAMPGSSSTSRNNNQPAGYNRMQRTVHVSRARRSGVIVGARPLVPASVVPEELINQVRESVSGCVSADWVCVLTAVNHLTVC